jgi:hypothetical protein
MCGEFDEDENWQKKFKIYVKIKKFFLKKKYTKIETYF